MPRSPSGVYSAPPGTTAVSGQTIASAAYNAFKDDLVQDANTARPLNAGGTGAATDVLARENLGVYGRSFLIDTTGTTAEKAYDNQVIEFTTSGTLSTEPAADLGDGWRCYLLASGGAITINPNLDETINGAATYVLPVGASGVLSVYNGNFRFEPFAPPNIGRFMAHKNGTGQSVTIVEKITFGTTEFNDGGYYNTTDSRFTPPAGKYRLSASYTVQLGGGNRSMIIELRKNGNVIKRARGYADGLYLAQPQISVLVEANGTDYFEIWYGTTDAFTIIGNAADTWFCGEAI